MKKYLGLVVILLCSMFLCSCATTGGTVKLGSEGTTQVFEATYDKVWKGALFACEQNRLTIDESSVDKGYISAKAPLRAESWGETVKIWVSKKADNSTEVKVVSKQVGPALLFWCNWEKPTMSLIDSYIKTNK